MVAVYVPHDIAYHLFPALTQRIIARIMSGVVSR